MRTKKIALELVLAALTGALVLFFADPASRLITSFFKPSRAPIVVARLTEHAGPVAVVRGGQTERRAPKPESAFELNDGDRLETAPGSEATVILSSQDELIVAPQSIVGFELWNELDANSPIYVHVLAGDVKAKRTGVRGRAYVVRAGKLFTTGQRPGEKRAPLVVSRKSATDLNVGSAPVVPDDALATAEPAAPAPEPSEPAAHKDDPETLANEYVDELVASRQPQFQKCWLSRLKDKPDLKGSLTVQFEITRRGKVRELKVTGSTLNDDQLSHCVSTVVERLQFRTFTGPEISISYPITFE